MIIPFGIKLNLVPAGVFSLGRLEKDGEYALLNDPIEIIIDKDYWMAEIPVTNRQFEAYLTDTGKAIPDYYIEHYDGEWVSEYKFEEYFRENPDAPVVGVSYADAQNYIDWLNTKVDEDIRLPTEAEFEWASKAGCQCVEYCIGAQKVRDSLRSYGDPPRKKVPSVKEHCPNPFGLYDMHGLIWQWCSDWYWDYDKEKNVNPSGPNEKPEYAPWKGGKREAGRVIRGGSFNYGVLHARCSTRQYAKERDQNFNVGFRIVANCK